MSYSRRQLYAMGEPLGDSATRREVGGKIIYGSGGGGGNAEKQTTIVDLPEWAKPYAKESLGKASALTASPYQTYGGERVAQFVPMQKQAFDAAAQQQVADQVGFGSGLAGLAGTTSFRDQGMAGGFMSPYMQNVVDQQMSSAQRQADIAATQRGAQAVRAGAFGGSRQAVENAEAARALASQKGEIQAKGLQSAFEQAQQQFNQEQAQRLNAAQTLGGLGQQQFGQEMDITGRQAQFGADQRAATQEILSTQYQDFLNQQRAPYDQLSFMSSIIRGTPMGQTTTQYQPPASPTSQLLGLATAGAGAYGAYQGAQGRSYAEGGEVHSYAAGGIASLNQPQLAARAQDMSPAQLAQMQQMPSITKIAELTLADEAKRRADMLAAYKAQEALMAQKPELTVAAERMAALGQGIGGLDDDMPEDFLVGDEYTAASGGIVAFSAGNEVPAPSSYRNLSFEDLKPYREGAYLRSRSTRIDPITNQPIEFGDFLRLQQAEAAQAARPAAQGIIQARDTAVMNDESRKRANASSWQSPAAAPGAKTEGIASVGTSGATGAPTGKGTPGAAPAGIAALLPKDLQAMQAQRRSEVEAAAKAGEKIESDLLAATKRDQEEMGPIGVEREKRLKAQEKSLEGAEDKNFNMALIEAGLAIMSGNSANAFENIGKGAMVGTKAYTTGMNRIQERKKELDASIMALDELRYGDEKASKKELREREAAVNKAKQQTATALAAVTGEDMKTSVDLYTKQLDRQTTLAAAQARSTASGGLTAAKRAELADKANDNVTQTLAKDMKLNMEVMRNPARREQLIQQEFQRLLNAAGGTSATSELDLTKWGKASVD
jgi:hypothetical protein